MSTWSTAHILISSKYHTIASVAGCRKLRLIVSCAPFELYWFDNYQISWLNLVSHHGMQLNSIQCCCTPKLDTISHSEWQNVCIGWGFSYEKCIHARKSHVLLSLLQNRNRIVANILLLTTRKEKRNIAIYKKLTIKRWDIVFFYLFESIYMFSCVSLDTSCSR